jgi:hypothetical protein
MQARKHVAIKSPNLACIESEVQRLNAVDVLRRYIHLVLGKFMTHHRCFGRILVSTEQSL